MIKLKYNKVSSFQFAQALQKIVSTPTHGAKASQLHKVNHALAKMRKQVGKEYQKQIVELYAQRGKEGKIIRPEGEPNSFNPDETKMAEFQAAETEFGKQVMELKITPLTLDLLADVKLSAQDLEALGPLYADHEGDIEDEAAEEEKKPALAAVPDPIVQEEKAAT